MITMMRPTLMALAVATTLSGCSAGRSAPAEVWSKNQAVQIEVTNHNWMDVNVYAVSEQGRFRLGTVTTGTTQHFRLPTHAGLNNLRLEADPIGGGQSFMSDHVMVVEGGRVSWSLENHLALSSLMVRQD